MLGVFTVVVLHLQFSRHHSSTTPYHNIRFTKTPSLQTFSIASSSVPANLSPSWTVTTAQVDIFYFSQVRQLDLPFLQEGVVWTLEIPTLTTSFISSTFSVSTGQFSSSPDFPTWFLLQFFLRFIQIGFNELLVKMAFELSNNSSSNLNSTLKEVFDLNLSNEN